jgi:type VI secretion system secreted protein VgrG
MQHAQNDADHNRYTKRDVSHDYSNVEEIKGQSESLYTDDNYKFDVEFSAIPAGTDYIPENKVDKPTIAGVQTAIVSAGTSNTPSGENTIEVDNQGRIKVIFHFDNDKPTSCFVRLGTMFSGNNWGSQFLPRVNTEVIVSFINGNIDKPIIIGTVYNAENKLPQSLPASKTQSYIKTRSMPGDGYNELLFEDKGGAELLGLRAQKDYKLHALNNSQTNIDNDQVEVIGNDDTSTVKANQTQTVEGNQTQTVHGDQTQTTQGNQTQTVHGNQSEAVTGNQTETVMKSKAESILIAKALSIGGAYQTTVGGAKNETVGLSSTEQVGVLKHVIVGEKYVLHTGDGYIELNADGTIIIKGTEVAFNAPAGVKINATGVDLNTSKAPAISPPIPPVPTAVALASFMAVGATAVEAISTSNSDSQAEAESSSDVESEDDSKKSFYRRSMLFSSQKEV